jgi:hypothetical protein
MILCAHIGRDQVRFRSDPFGITGLVAPDDPEILAAVDRLVQRGVASAPLSTRRDVVSGGKRQVVNFPDARHSFVVRWRRESAKHRRGGFYWCLGAALSRACKLLTIRRAPLAHHISKQHLAHGRRDRGRSGARLWGRFCALRPAGRGAGVYRAPPLQVGPATPLGLLEAQVRAVFLSPPPKYYTKGRARRSV